MRKKKPKKGAAFWGVRTRRETVLAVRADLSRTASERASKEAFLLKPFFLLNHFKEDLSRMKPRSDWFKIQEAADYAGVSLRTIRDWVDQKGLKRSKVGGIVRIHREWIDEFLDARAERKANAQDEIERAVESVLGKKKTKKGER